MISVGIVGGSGYTGKYLIQFCNDHPEIDNIKIYAKTSAGGKLHSIFPEFMNKISNIEFESVDNLSYDQDVYFLALPHGESIEIVNLLYHKGKKLIDLSADFRLDDPAQYKSWYGKDHTDTVLLQDKHFGLADVYQNPGSNLISNPGCYSTAALLSAIPLTSHYADIIDTINISAYSGSSGAGKSLRQDLLLSELYSNVWAYNVGKHRHEPEITQELKKSGFSGNISFVTHLLPIDVGIYSTTFIQLQKHIEPEEILFIYSDQYKTKKFVRLRDVPPQLKWVVGTNYCDINITTKDKTIIITTAIDNLIKGASGQAVQNMNLMFGWNEDFGLESVHEKNKGEHEHV